MRNKTSNIYTEWLPLIEPMKNEDVGKIFKAILQYQNGQEISSKNPVWLFIKSKIDDYNNQGKNISETRRIAGKKGGLAKASNCQQKLAKPSKSSNKRKEKKRKENIYPTYEEVLSYAEDRGRVDIAKTFFDYFSASDWIDSNGKEVQSWKQKFITWETYQQQPQVKINTVSAKVDPEPIWGDD